MVWISRIQEVELRIVDFVLLDAVLEFCTVASHETRSFVHNISHLEAGHG
jgi:hypothetical protein